MSKVTIRMTRTTNGADDGITVKTYEAGQDYQVGEDLARAFVDEMKVAERVSLIEQAGAAVKKAADAVTGKKKKGAEEEAPPAE